MPITPSAMTHSHAGLIACLFPCIGLFAVHGFVLKDFRYCFHQGAFIRAFYIVSFFGSTPTTSKLARCSRIASNSLVTSSSFTSVDSMGSNSLYFGRSNSGSISTVTSTDAGWKVQFAHRLKNRIHLDLCFRGRLRMQPWKPSVKFVLKLFGVLFANHIFRGLAFPKTGMLTSLLNSCRP